MDITVTNIFAEIDQTTEAQSRGGSREVELPATVVEELDKSGLAPDEVSLIVGSRERIIKLVAANEVLPPDVADRVSRLARIMSLAEKVFGESEKAFLWMRLPNPYLGGVTPMRMLESEPGSRIVEDSLLRIEYGVFA